MADEVGIVAHGGYVPQMRLQRSAIAAANGWSNPALRAQGRGERAFAAWDEDVVTMAVEAARDALHALPRDAIGGVLLASTTPPFADRLNAGIMAGALRLPTDVVALDIGGTLRAGTSAAIAGLALAASSERLVLVAAAERRRSRPGSTQEMANGDASAAIVFGTGALIARVLGTHSITQDFVDHFRATGEAHEYAWEERWVREEGYLKLVPICANAALAKAKILPDDVTTLVLPSPLAKIEAALAKKLGIAEMALTDGHVADLGYSGAAHGLVLLSLALERARPGDHILLLSFANGCDAIVLQVTQGIEQFRSRRGVSGWLAAGKAVNDYMRFLSNTGEVAMEWGARAEFGNKYALTMEYRFTRDMLGFVGGRDRQTGVVQFPKTPSAVAPGAHGVAQYDDVPLADLPASVVASTADWLTYHPSPPLYFGLVQFDNGARVAMEFVDVASGAVNVGDRVDMTFRIKEIDRIRNYRHYFWKATPAAAITETRLEAAP